MNEFERKSLEDRDARAIAGGVALILFSPLFGIVALAIFASTTAFFGTTAMVAILGIFAIAGAIQDRRERKKHFIH